MKYIIILNENTMFKIYKQPFEKEEDTYYRGWYMINNKVDDNISKIILNKLKGMEY